MVCNYHVTYRCKNENTLVKIQHLLAKTQQCYKYVLHNQQEQISFHFLILFLKESRDLQLLIS